MDDHSNWILSNQKCDQYCEVISVLRPPGTIKNPLDNIKWDSATPRIATICFSPRRCVPTEANSRRVGVLA